MKELIAFRVGGSSYALPAELVAEIVEAGPVSHRLPCDGGEGPELTRVHGRWVPVLELADALPEAEPTGPDVEGSMLLMLGKGMAQVGLRVEEVSEVAVAMPSSSHEDSGLIELNGELVQLVDVSALLPVRSDVLTVEGDTGNMTDSRTSTERAKIVVFRLLDDEFGVDVMRTVEVLKPAGLRTVPKAPDFIEGMVNLRDQVVPVVDMRKRLGLPERSEGETTRLLVVAIGDSRVALRVDDVPGVLELSPDAVSPAPDLFRGLERRYLEGIARDGERLMILLDLEAVLTSKERLALQKLVEASETSPAEDEPKSEGPGAKSKAKSSKRSKSKSSRRSKKKKTRRGKKKTAD